MEYSIYTYGYIEIVEKALNVLAMLCKDQNIFFRPVMMLSATLGAVWVGMKAIWEGSVTTYFKNWLLPTMLIFNIMFVPRVTVKLIDPVDQLHQFAAVDNVPVGVALVGHVASHITYKLTQAIESRFVPAEYEGTSFTKAGPMFAANLMASSRSLVVSDPILRDNLKNYVDQCYVWPYLYTNISPGREAALKSTDILSFMKTNAHDGLGMYWNDGRTRTFKTCREVSTTLVPHMNTEKTKAIVRLSAQVLPNLQGKTPEEIEGKMTPLGMSAWDAIAQDSATVHKRVEQQMVINAGREAMDDSIERLGGARRFPQLISYSATRADEQQNYGFLVAGASASKHLPIFQGVMMALLLMSFVLVVAFTFQDEGLKIWGTWFKLILWVQSWPIFYGILNCIGLFWLHKASKTIGYTFEPGITWQTQNGLADASWDAYCAVQNLFLAVPMISWMMISKSGHALVSLTERALPALGRSLGASIVDNTPSFDNQTLHTRNMNTMQLSQQTMGSNYNLASTMNDGRMVITTGTDGYQTIQENQSRTRFTMDLNNALQGQFSQQLNREKSAAMDEAISFSNSRTAALEHSREFLQSFAKGESRIEGISEAENTAIQESVRQYLSSSDRHSHLQTLTDSKSWSFNMDMGLGASAPSGVGPSANIGTSGNSTATNDTTDQHALEVTKGRDINQDVTKAINASINDQLNYSTEASKTSSENFRASYNEAQTHAKEHSAHLSRIERLQEMGSITESKGYTFNEAKTDEFLEYVAKAKGMSKVDIAYRMSENANFAQSAVQTFLGSHMQNITHAIEDKMGPINSANIEGKHKSNSIDIEKKASSINEDVLTNIEKRSMDNGIGTNAAEGFTNSNNGFKDRIKQSASVDKAALKRVEREVSGMRTDIEIEREKLKDRLEDKKDGVLGVRALKKIGSDE